MPYIKPMDLPQPLPCPDTQHNVLLNMESPVFYSNWFRGNQLSVCGLLS